MIACPPAGDLERLLDEALATADANRVAAHVETCGSCQAALDRLTTVVRPRPADYTEDFRAARRALKLAGDTDGRGDTLGPDRDRPEAPPDVPGYEVVGEVGRGGMAVVYLARATALGRPVALKVLRDSAPAEARARFLAEARSVARLQHPNIVQIFDAGEAQGRPFLALEFVPGGTLDRHADGKPQPPRWAAGVVADLARAVAHAHRAGIVHRDLKPANILLANDQCPMTNDQPGSASVIGHSSFRPKVGDFGLALWVRETAGPRATAPGTVLGTPSYMAPEQVDGARHEVGPSVDVYALGGVLYHLLTGRPAFLAEDAVATLAQVVFTDPVPVRRLVPAVPRDLETICLKCLEKDPGRRYPTADALAEDLDRFLAGRPTVARPLSVIGRARRAARRNPIAAALTAVCVAGAAGLLAGWAHHTAALGREVEATRAAEARADGEARITARQRDLAVQALRRTASELSNLMKENPGIVFSGQKFLDGPIRDLEELLGGEGGLADADRAAVHAELGDLYTNLNRFDQAIHHYRRAREAAGAVLQADPRHKDARPRWVYVTGQLARFGADGQGTPTTDLDLGPAEAVARELLTEEPARTEAWHCLVQCAKARALIAHRAGDLAGWRRDLGEMLAHAGAWRAADPKSGEAPMYEGIAHLTLGIDRSPPDRAAADDHLKRAVALQEGLVRRDPKGFAPRRQLAALQDTIGRHLLQRGDAAGAHKAALTAVRLLREVAAADPGQPRFRRDLVTALLTLGMVEGARKNSPAVLETLRESVQLLRDLDAAGLLKDNPADRELLRTCEAGVREMEERLKKRP
jgi:eukaryotic-like serine/threonine-protein kinase